MTILDANKGFLRAGFDDESGDLKLYDSAGNSLTGEGGLTITQTDPTTGQPADIGGDSVLQTPITDSGLYVSDGNVRKITLGFKPTASGRFFIKDVKCQ